MKWKAWQKLVFCNSVNKSLHISRGVTKYFTYWGLYSPLWTQAIHELKTGPYETHPNALKLAPRIEATHFCFWEKLLLLGESNTWNCLTLHLFKLISRYNINENDNLSNWQSVRSSALLWFKTKIKRGTGDPHIKLFFCQVCLTIQASQFMWTLLNKHTPITLK